MPKYIVEVHRTQKAKTTMEIVAGTPWEAKEKALETANEASFSTYDSDYQIEGHPIYVRAEGLENKYTPIWEKMAAVMKDLGYTLKIKDTEDEPAHFSKGNFINSDRKIGVEIYLSEENDNTKGNIKITPKYPVFDFDHTDDPRGLNLRVSMVPRTYKDRLTTFVTKFEKAHEAALTAQKELAEASSKAKAITDRLNEGHSYDKVHIDVHRWDKQIKFSVQTHNISDPKRLEEVTRVLREEGIA